MAKAERFPGSQECAPDRSAAVPKSESTVATAKVNLTLRIFGRRDDGFHELESLVAFAPFGDRLTLWLDRPLDLEVSGPMAVGAGPLADNLAMRAARALTERIEGLTLGRFVLVKRLPSGAGLGGGSADAAAALRLIAKVNRLALEDPRVQDAARATGADVPVCLDPRPRIMRGIGEVLSAPLVLPKLGILIVHPGLPLPTGSVFKALGLAPGEQSATRSPAPAVPPLAATRDALLSWLAIERNDLESAASSIAPQIADVLGAIGGLAGCRLARMSGSGSSCFGLFDSARTAAAAAKRLAAAHRSWWVRAGLLGGNEPAGRGVL
jgi:4-diphosphocytidyl-2-C-methyl-D-erythritol kinase